VWNTQPRLGAKEHRVAMAVHECLPFCNVLRMFLVKKKKELFVIPN
jgi:hypothetical protein